ncbi:MAG: LacI family DNA-binding transcriptional regulator [Lentisphaeria bacterium]|nr:LacI family DNA-binding transcriptional regulator [Lentisphaeria bacterium]
MAEAKNKNSSSATALAQVAKKARVSPGTVSRVFNNSSLVPFQTRSRVIRSARELGFRPRVGVRNRQIALVTEPPHKTVMGGYVNTMTQYICFALSRQDAGITMITEDRIRNLADCWFDGIIGIAWEATTIDILKTVRNLPVVWLSDEHANFFHSVYIDARKTGSLAGEYLLDKGHRKIAVIHENDCNGFGRADGVRMAMAERNASPETMLFTYTNDRPLHMVVKQLIDAGCTAVWVTGEDMKSVEVYWLIRELLGKRIPEDISVLGFEHPGMTEFLCPAQTSLVSPLREIAEKAVELVMSDDPGPLRKIEYQVRLIERNSVISLNK